MKQDRERAKKLKIAVHYLLSRNCLKQGDQTKLARHFKVSRQRVHQIVNEERRSLGTT